MQKLIYILLEWNHLTIYEFLKVFNIILIKRHVKTMGYYLMTNSEKTALQEVEVTLIPKRLRALFITILVHNAPSNPAALWNLHII